MNRATIIYLALAVLLAHTLAIHKTPAGDFAPPFEVAHVAYRQGRNLVHQETASWLATEAVRDSYPSLPWIGLSWAAERLNLGPNRVTQVFGVLAALATIGVLAAFTSSRIAGLVATVLLAASGAVAAAAGSGTEFTTTMLLVTTTVFAFERSYLVALALSAAALTWIRPEGIAVVAVLAVFDAIGRPAGRSRAPALAAGAAAWIALLGLRWFWIGTAVPAYWREAFRWDAARIELGVAYVASFFRASGSAPLVLLPLALALSGRLPGRGVRALGLMAAWTALVMWSGGNDLPFWLAMVPVIPMLFLAIQSSVAALIDSKRRTSPVVWTLLVGGVLASFLASKVPGNLGPLPLEDLQEAWMEPGDVLARNYALPLARPGLLIEAKQTERLRSLGVFLRDRTLPTASVHTLWPGAIGYLSRRRVVDLLGRAWPGYGSTTTRSWSGSPKVDLVRSLRVEPDYLVLFVDGFGEGAKPLEFLRATLDRYDIVGGTPERMLEMLALLSNYELICVPVPERSKYPNEPSPFPFPLLRARSLHMTPRLEWQIEGGRARLLAEHVGHELVVDLRVRWIDDQGVVHHLTPDGRMREGIRHARNDLLLVESGERRIELFSMRLPAGNGQLEASLFNPGAGDDSALVALGDEVALWL